jgi:uncharacterized protein DUF3108
MNPISASFRGAGLAVLTVSIAAAQAAPPQRVTLTYDTSYNGMVVAELVEVLEHDSQTYAITSQLRGRGILALLGVLKRSSRGRITPQGLEPEEFRDQRGNRPAVTAKFDWVARSVTQEQDGKSETLKMPVSAQDPLSLAYSFAFVPPNGKEFEVTRADGRGLTPFRFTVVGTEKLATPAGEMQTLHVAKERDGPEDKSTDIWFAAEHSYLPVRVLVVDKDGTRADQVVTRIGN